MTQAHTAALLVELLTEELPPKALAKLGEAFSQGLFDRLKQAGLVETSITADDIERYATPRRLAVLIPKVLAVAPDKQMREKVLPVSVALDSNGQATPPLAKKLAALGFPNTTLEQLERASDGKAEAFFLSYTAPGITLSAGLQTALSETLAKLPIPKVMSYQRPDGTPVQFVRPVHRLVALHGSEVINVQALGLSAGRVTLGHRFLSTGTIELAQAGDYRATLHAAHVMANYNERRDNIRAQLQAQAGADRVVMPDALLDEVNSLVEWPVVYACRFEDQFLAVPQECLILTMQTNQKYFALTDDAGKLRSRFLIVSNLATATPGEIIEGNERVVRPRLADAKFFFEQDQKKPLAGRIPQLANVVYHNKLGSQLQRTNRITEIAAAIAPLVGADTARAMRAAQLAKADLLTDMVGEFPELQGTMGTYYARHDGEADDVALACSEHYQPRFSGDALPSTLTGTVVELADKLETLVGIWGIGLAPTGEKDPFALRRHALGILRIVLEKSLPLDLRDLLLLVQTQFAGLTNSDGDTTDAILSFLSDRLRGLLRERGYSANEVEAVLSQNPTRIDDLTPRLDAVRTFAALPEAEALAAANKRISNILKKSEEIGTASVNPALLQEAAEKTLFETLRGNVAPAVQRHLQTRDYTQALSALAQLRAAVDTFFNDVMVNADDPAVRANRLALLSELHAQMNCVADISKLAA